MLFGVQTLTDGRKKMLICDNQWMSKNTYYGFHKDEALIIHLG